MPTYRKIPTFQVSGDRVGDAYYLSGGSYYNSSDWATPPGRPGPEGRRGPFPPKTP